MYNKGRLKFILSLLSLLLLISFFNSCKKEKSVSDLIGSAKLAYRSLKDHRYGEIYEYNGKTGESKVLSSMGTGSISDMDYAPKYSPDGGKLAYKTFGGYLRIRNLASGSIAEVTTKNVNQFDWSPDGAYLTWLPNDMSGQIEICKSDGTENRTLTNYSSIFYPMGDSAFNFKCIMWTSGNGLLAAYQGSGFYDDRVVELDIKSGKIKRYLQTNLRIGRADDYTQFHRGTNQFVWASDDSIFISNPVSGSFKKFSAPGAKSVALNPSGNKVAYTIDRLNTYTDIVTCNLNGFDRNEVTVGKGIVDNIKAKANFSPSWLDDSKLVYGAGSLYLVYDDFDKNAREIIGGVKAYGDISIAK